MTGRTTCPAIERDPLKIGGNSTVAGTRVPPSAPFENRESEATVQQFREWFPELQECQTAAVIERRTASWAASSRTALPGTRIPPLQPGRCPCCGYTGRADRRACASDASLCRRCQPGNCPRTHNCPGPKGGGHRQPSPAGEPD